MKKSGHPVSLEVARPSPRPASSGVRWGRTRTRSKLCSAGAARCGTWRPGASAWPGASPAAAAFGDCSPDSVAAPPDGRTPAGGPLADGSPAGGTLADGALADCGAGVTTVGTLSPPSPGRMKWFRTRADARTLTPTTPMVTGLATLDPPAVYCWSAINHHTARS